MVNLVLNLYWFIRGCYLASHFFFDSRMQSRIDCFFLQFVINFVAGSKIVNRLPWDIPCFGGFRWFHCRSWLTEWSTVYYDGSAWRARPKKKNNFVFEIYQTMCGTGLTVLSHRIILRLL